MKSSSSEESAARFTFRELIEFFVTDEVRSIARRMFVTNAMDALLAYAGAVAGNLLARNTNPIEYIATGVGMALSISLLSNFLATFIVEQAEREIELKEISKHLLKEVNSSIFSKAPKVIALYVAIWSALGALVFPILASTPFLLALANILDTFLAAILSLALVVGILFALGYYLGSLIGRNKTSWGLKLALIGLIPLIVTILSRLVQR